MPTEVGEHAPAIVNFRHAAAAVILGLWGVCLFLPALGAGDGEYAFWAGWTAPPGELRIWWSGAQVLAMAAPGALIAFGFEFAKWAWFANFTLMHCVWRLARGRRPSWQVALIGLSLASLAILAPGKLPPPLPGQYEFITPIRLMMGYLPDNAREYPVRAFGAGFWLWLALQPGALILSLLPNPTRRTTI